MSSIYVSLTAAFSNNLSISWFDGLSLRLLLSSPVDVELVIEDGNDVVDSI